MDIHVFDITQEDVLVSETTKREQAAEQAFDEAVEAARHAQDAADAAERHAREARLAALRARPPGVTTLDVARRIMQSRQ